MTNMFVDPFTLEVARAVAGDLSQKLGEDFCSKPDRERLVPVLLALRDLGLLFNFNRGRKEWFLFDPDEIVASHQVIDDTGAKLGGLMAQGTLSFTLKKPEMLRSIELSTRCRDELDVSVVHSSWAWAGGIIKRIIDGDLRLIGSATEEGLIVADLAKATTEEERYVWASLGNESTKSQFMVDLESPLIFEGGPVQFLVKAAAPASKYGRSFVTLMGHVEALFPK